MFTLLGGASLVTAADPVKPVSAPKDPEEVARTAKLLPGFEISVFAAEPDIVQPIAFTIDDRGRLWVVEGLTYPTWITDGKPGRDRVVILEDTNGDGRHDKRTVFLDNGTNLSGIEVGFGGVWLCSCPNLIFVADKDGDDKADEPPQILIDGFDLKARHNVVNGMHWGPDGWLYGLNGILSNSKLGKPGTPEDRRVFMNCGVWRYHPTKHRFEVVAHGTTNPWGLDWDAHGRMFLTNCVIEHLFHVTPGGHYKRMFGQDAMPHSYELLQTCADHIHWGGGQWTDSRGGKGVHDTAGGGHAHVGAMIYQGDNFPDEYRGSLFTCNIHGNRINRDTFEPKNSGVVAHHAADFLRIDDPWFRGLELKYGPDGGVYITDWSDDGECHDYTEQDINRQNGRIYKVTYGPMRKPAVDLAKESSLKLVARHNEKNAWFLHHARRILQERAATGNLEKEAIGTLRRMLTGEDEAAALKSLMTLHAAGVLNESAALKATHHESAVVRARAIDCLLDEEAVSAQGLDRLAELAKKEPSAMVRLSLAAGLQRLPASDRWAVAQALVERTDDLQDQNIPLMLWYGIEPLVVADRDRSLQLLTNCRIPLIRQFIARRAASP